MCVARKARVTGLTGMKYFRKSAVAVMYWMLPRAGAMERPMFWP